jgi:hypothetical protein
MLAITLIVMLAALFFLGGTLLRCQHSLHRTEENAPYCEKNLGQGMLIGKVLEER